jgi:hypothetical protein
VPEIIPRILQNAPLLVQWYRWGAIVGFVTALAVLIGIAIDARRVARDARLWQSLAATAIVLEIPALLARVQESFALEMRASLAVVAGFSIVGALLSVATLVGYAVARSRVRSTCPQCGQPQDLDWAQCPYHAAPETAEAVSLPTIVDLPAVVTEGGDVSPLPNLPPTVILNRPPAPESSGPLEPALPSTPQVVRIGTIELEALPQESSPP